MKAFAVVGVSSSGKTRLIERLIPELKRRGNSIAVVKHCSHGFSLTPEEKDSWKLMEAGSDSVFMLGPDQAALLRKNVPDLSPSFIAGQYFRNVDIVLVEGGKKDARLRKIEVLRKGIAEEVKCSGDELLAVISDVDVSVGKPVYHPDQIGEIADFLESCQEDEGSCRGSGH